MMSRLVSLDGNNLLDEVGHALSATSDLLASVVELLETLCPWNDLLAAPVGHPLVLLLVLKDADDDRVGDGAADVGGGHRVETLVLGDVVLEEQGVRLGSVEVGLSPGSLLQWSVVLVPHHLGLGNTEDF